MNDMNKVIGDKKASTRRWRELHKEHIQQYNKEYIEAHREERRKWSREYKKAHPDYFRKQMRAYVDAHREEINKRNLAYHRRNREGNFTVDNHMERDGIPMICMMCGHVWNYTGKSKKRIACPKCNCGQVSNKDVYDRIFGVKEVERDGE